MPNMIDDLLENYATLRKVTVVGPMMETGGRRRPMWVLSAGSPSFNYQFAYDANGKESGVTADHTHPLRVLAAQQPGPAPRRWMQPSLMSVHLVLGARNRQYKELAADVKASADKLLFEWIPGTVASVSAAAGRALQTCTEDKDASEGHAPFVQIAAQLLPSGPPGIGEPHAGDWMQEHAADGIIPVPPMRLVSSRIGIRARLSATNGLKWLTRLGIVTPKEEPESHTWPTLWLTPDGMEFDAELPFPGRPGAEPLQGRVLLHPDPVRKGKLRLTLVEATAPQAWLAAWYGIVPAAGDAAESLLGLKFAARRDSTLPAFSWQVEHDGKGPMPLAQGTVWVAARDCELQLASPRMGDAVDSVAALRLAELSITDVRADDGLGKAENYVEFVAQAGEQSGAIACTCLCTPDRVALRVGGSDTANPVSLDIDAGRLAEELREAYGLPTPPVIPMRRAAGIDYGAAYGRPLLAAFVPLDEGWLQLPVPNLGPLDTSNDLALAGGASVAASVLNGFLRLRHSGLGDAVQSVYRPGNQPLRDQEAPWSVTVERAAGANARVRLLPRGAGTAALLIRASVVLHGAAISARGLLWLSADRPDADEALPRLGAGPGSFLDAHMHSTGAPGDASPLFASVDGLEASMARGAATAASLDWKRMSLGFRTDSKRWVGELLKPNEARNALFDAYACVRAGKQPAWTYDAPDAVLALVRNHAHGFRAELTRATLRYRRLMEPLELLAAIPAIATQIKSADDDLVSVAKTAANALPRLDKAQAALDEARDKLALEPPAPLPRRAPWPAVAWLRHPVLPLVSTMPMTRSAAGGPRPLESRELFPLALLGTEASDQPPQPLLVLAGLVQRPGSPLPALDENAGFTLAPLAMWPVPRGLEAVPKAPPPDPERGIAMASVGVPGVELRVLAASGPGKPPAYEGALRYDLPLLDEAFATATLPPPAGTTSQQAPVLDSVATALDWPLMAQLWARQERKHQNARVVDSYACGYRAVDAPLEKIDILSLMRGLVWKARIGFTTTHAAGESLSYGSVSLNGWTASGNDALAGYDGAVTPTLSPWQQVAAKLPAPSQLMLLGYSPATVKVDGMDLDNSMSGAMDPVPNDQLIERRLAVGGASGLRLVTLAKAESIVIGGRCFKFWFKDLLFDDDTAELDNWDAGTAFDSADSDVRLAASGGEWRLAPANPLAAEALLRLGRGELPFLGLRLEPLRLTRVKLAHGWLSEATLVCRLTLNPRGDGPNFVTLVLSRSRPDALLEASVALLDGEHPLVFNSNATDLHAGSGLPQRRVRITATPAITAGELSFRDTGFEVEVAGRMVRIGDAAIELPSATGNSQVVRVLHESARSAASGGGGRLTITRAELCAGYTLDVLDKVATLNDVRPNLSWERHVEIFAGATTDGEPALRWTLGARPSLTLFGKALGDFDAHTDEGNGVLALAINDEEPLIPSAPKARLGAALLVRLGQETAPGAVALSGGSCQLTLLQEEDGATVQEVALSPGVRISQGKADIIATADADGHWSGVAVLDAVIAATSDIRWPALLPGERAEEIPLPKHQARNNNGRVRVKPADGDGALHTVRWMLSGHRLPLGLAAALLGGHGKQAWVTPVTAQHCLSRGERQITWTGIESLAIGPRCAIVPRLPTTTVADDIKTFAARYAHAIVGGEYEKHPEEGMLDPGIGAIATVLQGTLGREFREEFWKTAGNEGLLFAGGFLGQLDTGGDSAPLLRLPILAGSGLCIEQTGIALEGVELAWHDGPAARALARTRATAPTPANASQEALAAALLAGSLAGASNPSSAANADGAMEMTGAMLVEQSHVVAPATQLDTLKKHPFFLAAAVTVSAVLNAVTDGERREAASLSLVGGRLQRSGRSHALAASVAMQPTPPVLGRSARHATVFVLGQASRHYRWDRGLPSGDGENLAPYLRRLAPSYDADPAGFLFVRHPGAGLPRYLAGVIVPPGLEASGGGNGSPTVFADGRRGPPTAPAEPDLRWLAPPREGAAGPVRDAALSGNRWTGSGIAGLARRVALAAYAGIDWLPSERTAVPHLVWLSSTQVPVYLPLRIAGLRGAPVGWLQQATPQVRLPIGQEVNATLVASRQPGPAGTDDRFALQGFLPEALSHAAVGERAGIVTLRRSRLLANLDGEGAAVQAYDAAYSRFGAPAQAGSSWPRKLRTPRPGPLPANTGDASRDRRVQASYVRPLDAGSATIGSTDIVQGGPGSFEGITFSAWSIEVCAMPESASLVSERWDSTLRLACRIEVRRDDPAEFKPTMTPSDFLASALFGEQPTAGVGNTEAVLRIGDRTIDYLWLKPFLEAGDNLWKPHATSLPDDTKAPAPAWWTVTATVNLVLDARPTIQQGGGVFAEFAQALADAGSRPSLELQWTVLPRSGGAARTLGKEPVGLGLVRPPYPSLIAGSKERPSLTLRFPLYPVRQARGILPLTPATLVFGDPAYDREVAGVPALAPTRLEAAPADALDARGELRLVLYADRARVNRRGVLTLMVDIAYERRLDELAQAVAEAAGALRGGDLVGEAGQFPLARIGLNLVPVDGPARTLRLKDARKMVTLVEAGTVYEMPLAWLRETDGSPARLRAGDILQVDAALGFDNGGVPQPAVELALWHNASNHAQAVTIGIPEGSAPHSLLNITLTDEAVAEPPPALYLALQRSGKDDAPRLSVPLHAQSPLPRRLDLIDAARGFRQGLLRRRADFVWYLSSTNAGLGTHSLVPVKSDRNGQAYFPVSAAEFQTPRRFPQQDDNKEQAK